ncbi:MAG TPA: VOC family protein [Steroidobacteraceae bacterium]|nr:VOC family protein [Steroidobacteraceae bacterium]
MPLTAIEHCLVITNDLEATRQFYCEALGLRLGPRPPLAFPGYWLYVGEVPCIHVAEWRTYTAHSAETGLPVSAPAPGTGPVDHIAFNAADYEEMLARLARCGVQASRNDPPGGTLRQLFVTDPNGVKIELNFRVPAVRGSARPVHPQS